MGEENLLTKEKLLSILMDSSPDQIYFKDDQHQFVMLNEATAENLGVSPEEAVGKTDYDFFPEEKADRYREDEKAVMEKGEPVTKIENTGQEGEERWNHTTKIPIFDDEGDIIGIAGINRDFTERKKAEKREEFLHSLLRHDLKNKLANIRGYLELLKDYDISDDGDEFLDKAMDANKSAFGLIESVRNLREVRKEEISETKVGSAISDAISECESQASECGMEINYEECECVVKGGSLLDELFSNLVGNSVQHSEGDLVKIWAHREGDDVVVTVEDDGKGISDEVKDKILEKGFKKGENAGSGLGMHLVEKILEAYGGHIEVKDSELGGARFDVHLKKA